MIDYCDRYSNFTNIWIKNGFSPCFFFTISPSIFFVLSVVLGCIQLIKYGKHSIPLERYQKSNSPCFYFQLLIIVALAIEPLLRITLVTTLVNKGTLYGYQWLETMFSTASWVVLGVVVFVECRRSLPSIPSRGHGIIPILAITVAFLIENLSFVSFMSPLWWFKERNPDTDLRLGFFLVRYVLVFFSFLFIILHPGTMLTRPFGYETFDTEEPDTARGRPHSTWSGFKSKFDLFWPFMWPKGSPLLQLVVIICLMLLVIGRVVNLFIPIFYKKIVESLTIKNHSEILKEPLHPMEISDDGRTVHLGTFKVSDVEFRWDLIVTYVFLWFLQGGISGFLSNCRSFLWTFVQQYTTRSVEVNLFAHLHRLSLRWHLSRKTGEVLRVMDRGTRSVNNLLSYMLFNILPTFADIFIAIVFFFTSFNAWFSLIILVTMAFYLAVTILITEWRTRFRRQMNKLDNDLNSKAVDSLINFETVKYYGTEEFEVDRYQSAVLSYQVAERFNNFSLNLLNVLQTSVISIGLLAGSLLCAWYVANRSLTVGDYVLFAAYINQLYTPLNWFGSYYRMIQQSFIDMENMFELLNEQQEVRDVEGAAEMVVSEGQIDFEQVSFRYRPEKPILEDITFSVPPGHTYALVGPSGAGKSTLIRLLFRFYDVDSGRILIDGQDISKVKQASLRNAIGVVPQDTVLFNDDIEYNIRYGRVNATKQDVEGAAQTAEIHDRILSFPDGYKTMVGERGLKLSGGEKQRVAIARTVLKAPSFVLLDEATSALDTRTERQIQSSLAKVCENRTTLIVAHRLSTIIHADKIIVLKDGCVVESGRHEALLQKEGSIYSDMWKQQLTANNASEADAKVD